MRVIRDLVAIFGVIAGFTYYVLTVRNTQNSRPNPSLSYSFLHLALTGRIKDIIYTAQEPAPIPNSL